LQLGMAIFNIFRIGAAGIFREKIDNVRIDGIMKLDSEEINPMLAKLWILNYRRS